MPTFDYTIHVSDVALVLGLIVAVFKMVIGQRDINQRILAILGTKEPPDGVLGDVHTLKIDTREHRDWLIELRRKNGS